MTMVQIAPSTSVADHIRKFGYNPDIDVAVSGTEEDVTPFGDAFFPTAVQDALDIDIVSTSTADDTGGTGAITILLQGLDENYMLQTEIVTLDGQTDVHPANDYLRIFRVGVLTAGTGLKNAGTITIDVGGSNVMAQILPNRGKTLQAAYTIPANYKGAYLLKWNASVMSKQAAYVNFAIEVKEFGGAWQTQEFEGASDSSPFFYAFVLPEFYPAKADIRVRGVDSDGDNQIVSAGFELMLTGRSA